MLKKSILVLATLAALLFGSAFAHGQTKEQLEAELERIEQEIRENKQQLEVKKTERKSLEQDVTLINSKVKQAQLSLRRRDLAIEALGKDIKNTELNIKILALKADRSTQSLSQLLRKTNESEQGTLVELVLRGDSFSAAFTDSDHLDMVRDALNETLSQIDEAKEELQSRRSDLQEQHSEQEQLRLLQEQEKLVLERREKEKKEIVAAAKGVEKAFETQIRAKELSAAEIRNAIFSLRDSTSAPVSFGTMYGYAKEASARTNVRPSVILAILTVESNLGVNVGKGTWTVDMHPTRDRPVFKEICAELGLDPNKMPVSKKPWYGWGGAMGPGQFIPSTWKGLVPRVSRMTGQTPPNPWDPRTAVFATAIYMMDAGADKQTSQAERLAAQRYLAGWKNAGKPEYQFYGREVMEFVEKYDRQIEVIGK